MCQKYLWQTDGSVRPGTSIWVQCKSFGNISPFPSARGKLWQKHLGGIFTVVWQHKKKGEPY